MALRGVAGLVLALMIGVAGCSGDGSSPEATGPGSELPGDKKPTSTPDEDGGDPPSAMCRLFTAAEIEDLLGTPVDNGSGAGPDGTACQWAGTDDVDAYAQVQVIDDTEYWENPSLGKGYEEVPGIGTEAYVIPELGGWKAGALTDVVAAVSIKGDSASRAAAVRFLRELLKRFKAR